MTTPEPIVPEPTPPEPNRPKVQRWARIVTRASAVVGVVLVLAAAGLAFAVRGPTDALNGFLSDLKHDRDAHAWTRLCESDQRAVSQDAFAAAWQRQRTKYGAVIDEIDAFTFEPFGTTRHLHYRLSFRNDKVDANTYAVDLVHVNDQWKVCSFFALSRNPAKPGVLSGFENW